MSRCVEGAFRRIRFALSHDIISSTELPVNPFLQIKDSIVKSISGIEVRNLQSLTQVTSVIARATLEPNEVTFDTQVCMTLHQAAHMFSTC